MDLSDLAPSDAVVALRGLKRGYRGLFAGLGGEQSPDDLARRSRPLRAPLCHVVAAARAISAPDRAVAAGVTDDHPALAAEDVDPAARPKPGAPTGPVHERLSELGLDANAAADRIAKVASEDWVRTGTIAGSGRTLTALDISREAVDAGVTHLREAEQVLATLRGRPIDED